MNVLPLDDYDKISFGSSLRVVVHGLEMRPNEIAVLAVFLSLVMYYLTNTTCDVRTLGYLGDELHPADGKLHALVTGGAGFIGSHATKRLLSDGYAVTVVDNLSRGHMGAIDALAHWARPGRFQFIKADLGQKTTVRQIFKLCKVDLVLHFASVGYVAESMEDPLTYYSNITSNTINVLEGMKRAGVTQLIYPSTAAVYGDPVELPATELSLVHPISAYGKAAALSEEIIRDYSDANPALKAVILRIFNTIGSDPDGLLGEYSGGKGRAFQRVSASCFDAALKVTPLFNLTGTSHVVTRDRTGVRDFVHVTDVVNATILSIPHVFNPPQVYNVGIGKGVSAKEFVAACQKVTGAKFDVVEQNDSRPGDCARVWADTEHIKHELGWEPKYPDLEQGLHHSWKWRKRHPKGYST